MNGFYVTVFLENEIPKFGCGWRLLEAKIGRKWAHLTLVATGKKARIETEKFIGICPRKMRDKLWPQKKGVRK